MPKCESICSAAVYAKESELMHTNIQTTVEFRLIAKRFFDSTPGEMAVRAEDIWDSKNTPLTSHLHVEILAAYEHTCVCV